PGEGGGGGEVEEVAADLVVDHVLEHGLVGVQDGVEVHIEHRVQLFHGERIPVARILADGKAGSAVYADIDRAVVFEGGGEQLVPGQIGRASCRERGGRAEGEGEWKTEERM